MHYTILCGECQVNIHSRKENEVNLHTWCGLNDSNHGIISKLWHIQHVKINGRVRRVIFIESTRDFVNILSAGAVSIAFPLLP